MRARMRASRRVAPISGMAGAAVYGATERAGRRPGRPRRPAGGGGSSGASALARGDVARLRSAASIARQVGLGDQHLARLGALVAGDDPAPLEHVDQPAGARVAEAQAALEHRGRRGAHLDDQLDRVAEQRILVGILAVGLVATALGRLRLDLLEQVLAQLGLALARPELGELRDLRLVDVGALDALQLATSRPARRACRPCPAATRRRSGRGSRASRSASETAKAIRDGTLALIMPVMTSTRGDCVASTRWMPTARAFCARRMIESSTSAGATIIRSASSSITHRMYGQRAARPPPRARG